MLKVAQLVEHNRISVTGLRAITIIGLLMIMPRSFSEIKNALIEYKLISENSSDDIIKIDLKTLKNMGCEIEREYLNNEYKYVLLKHPFLFNISIEEVEVLKAAYDVMKTSCNIHLLIEYDDLFKKISTFIADTEAKEALLGISVFKYLDVNNVKDLIMDCAFKRAISFIYETPITKKQSTREGFAQRLYFRNDKIYLDIKDFLSKKTITFNVQRIKSILSRGFSKKEEELDKYKVIFYLKNCSLDEILEEEAVIEINEKGFLIEAEYLNRFWAAQRILNFGSRCTVLEPLDFREEIIEKLKGTLKIYE